MEGARVLMLEAGRNYDPATETPMFQTPDWRRCAAAGTPDKPFGFYDATIDGGWQVPGEPYTQRAPTMTQAASTGGARACSAAAPITGAASRCATVRTISSRAARDGLGFDWPISYEDLAPYYDKVEMLIGVYGSNEGLENTPNSPPGCLLPPPKPLVSD